MTVQHRNARRSGLRRGLFPTTALAAGLGVWAPSAAAQGVEQVVVTAQKRQQTLQDVSASVSVLTGDTLDDAGVNRLDDIAGTMPNVLLSTASASRNSPITIRGISSEPNNPGVDPAVGVFVDGVYMSRPTTINTNLYDLERIEVIRGPQGTLYGKNTIAGAINFISRNPGDEFRVEGAVSFGTYGSRDVFGAVDVPLGEGAGLRVSGTLQQRDGLIENLVTGNDLNDVDEHGLKAALVFNPSDDLEIILRGDTSKADTANGALEVRDNGILTGSPLADADPFDRKIANDREAASNREISGISGEINWDVSGGTLTSIAAYRQFDWFNFNDNDYSPANFLSSGISEDQDEWSEELRFTSDEGGAFEYILGAFYAEQTYNTNSAATVGTDFFPLIAGSLPPALVPVFLALYTADINASILADIETQSWAAFAQGTYHLTDALRVTAGLRYSIEDKDVTHSQAVTGDPFAILAAPSTPRTLSRSDREWSPSVALAYEFSETLSAYGSYSRGFKTGGYNVFSITPADDAEYEPEFVDTFEFGVKTIGLDGALVVNASAFWLGYTDLQVNQLVLVGGVPVFQTSNAAEAESKGLEIEAAWEPVAGLDFTASYGYLDATFEDYRNATAAGDDYTGNRLPRAPRHMFGASAQLVTPVANGVDLFARADLSHRASIFFESDNAARKSDDALTLLHLRAGLEFEAGRYGIYAWGRNVTDEDYPFFIVDGAILPGQVVQDLAPPATYGVEVRAAF